MLAFEPIALGSPNKPQQKNALIIIKRTRLPVDGAGLGKSPDAVAAARTERNRIKSALNRLQLATLVQP